MKLSIDLRIFKDYPNLKVGVFVAKNIDNLKRISAVESLLRGATVEKQKEFGKKGGLEDDKRIMKWHEAYALFGAKPSKYQCSVEAMIKRIIEGGEIQHANSLVDMCNYFSLKYVIPVGAEDIDKFYGDVSLTIADGTEYFRPFGTVLIKQPKQGEVVYKDKGGIISRMWNYREAERTKITKQTTQSVIVMEDLNDIPIEKFESMMYEFQDLIERYLGGDVAVYTLNEQNNFIDLEEEGLKKADDSKISEKEKAFFMSQKKTAKIKIPKESKSVASFTEEKISFNDPETYREKLREVMKEIVGRKFPEEASAMQIEYPKEDVHGDYASNVAMKIASKVSLNPRAVAEELIKAIEKPDFIEKMEVAGPGFINFYLSEDALDETLKSILKEGEEYGESKIGNKKTMIIEYSQPNIAKPLGVHHLLSTIIGQSLYNLYSNRGFTTISINHIGDWGTQFGKLIYAYKKWGDKEAVEKDPIPELLKLYVKFHDEAERDDTLEQFGRDEFKKLEDGDEENRKLWKWVVEVSMKDTQITYDKLGGIHFDFTLGESFYEDKMKPVIEEGVKKGVFVKGDNGALIVNFEDPNMAPLVIIKSDGATLYSTRDLATYKYRLEKWDPSKILYVVDTAQSLYFRQLFETAKLLGWDYTKGKHVEFGRMQLPEGGMSTRKGNVILLNAVLDEAVKRAEKVLEEKNPNLENRGQVARAIGISAVKYNILSQNRTTDITFEWDKMLSFDSNSSAYLQYTYARARSILRKAKVLVEGGIRVQGKQQGKPAKKKFKQVEKEQFSLFEAIEHVKNGGDLSKDTLPDPEGVTDKEESLLRCLAKFSEHIATAAEENKPNILANYLYTLAQKFNSFYNIVPVIKADTEEKFAQRVNVVKAASEVLKNGLSLLEVEVLEEM